MILSFILLLNPSNGPLEYSYLTALIIYSLYFFIVFIDLTTPLDNPLVLDYSQVNRHENTKIS